MKIVHISDIHIRNLRRHKEYLKVFQNLCDSIHEHNCDLIVCTGDVAHTKTQLSPEFFDLTYKFFEMLLNTGRDVILIPGNHDGNLKNASRQDALTPIINALNSTRDNHGPRDSIIYFFKNSGLYDYRGSIVFGAFSCFDENNWPLEPTRDDRVHIALYHGGINNSETDIGWVMRGNMDSVNIFKNYDFAMLGDVHKRQFLTGDKRIAYAGSLIQQNFGECVEKGYLLWDINDRSKFDVNFIPLTGANPYVTVNIDNFDPDVIPINAHVRIKSQKKIMSHREEEIRNSLQDKDLSEIIFLTREEFDPGEAIEVREDFYKIENQNELIKKFLLEKYEDEIDDGTFDKVYALNSKYDITLRDDNDVARNIKWNIERVKFDNLFNFGPGNIIDFSDMEGVIGIFGPNGSGKSSIIDAILYGMFNSISKGSIKNINIMNVNANRCECDITATVNGKTHNIQRVTNRLNPGKHNEWARTTLSYGIEEKDLTGEQRNDTEKAIRKRFGTLEDFLMTSVSAQSSINTFIEKGATERKRIISKFIDLDIFQKKYKLAKDDMLFISRDIKNAKTPEQFKEELQLLLQLESEKLESISDLASQLAGLINKREKILGEIKTATIDLIPGLKLIDIDDIEKKINMLRKEISSQENKIKKENKKLQSDLSSLSINNISDFSTIKKNFEYAYDLILRAKSEVEKVEALRVIFEEKTTLLNGIPCGTQFPNCKFISDAHNAKLKIIECDNDISDIGIEAAQNLKDHDLPDDIFESIDNRIKNIKNIQDIIHHISTLQDALNTKNYKIAKFEIELEQAVKNRKKIEKNKELKRNINKFEKQRVYVDKEILDLRRDLESLNVELGMCKEQKNKIFNDEQIVNNLKLQYIAYEYYLDAMSKNGISYHVIKEKLPIINSAIDNVLCNIVNFKVYLEHDEEDKKIEIFIEDAKNGKRLIELASGSEKFISSIAIRVALIKITNLPKSNVFFIDEGFGSLDDEKINCLDSLFGYLKTMFDTIFIISHIDLLKDLVDSQLEITSDGNQSFIHFVSA